MADSNQLTQNVGTLDTSGYEQKIREAAARTRQVLAGPDLSTLRKGVDVLGRTQGGIGQTYQSLADTAISNFDLQHEDAKKKAERAASALEMVGESTLKGIKNLEGIQSTLRSTVQSTSNSWAAAAEKADEYVKAARGRVSEVLTKLDEIGTSMSRDRDFAKAHAMQTAVQSSLGSMKTEERNILETYGAESPEYMQFQQSKSATLATIQSNLHASYQQLEDQQKTNYMNAFGDAATKMNMYVGYQEQQHVETLKFQDDQRNAYALQASQLDVGIEQMKMAGMENLANWIIETPTFTMDTTPLVALVADIAQISTNQYIAYKTMKRTTKGGGSRELLSTLGTAAATGIGTAFGGPIGGALAGGAVKAATAGGKAASEGFSSLLGLSKPKSLSSGNANPGNE